MSTEIAAINGVSTALSANFLDPVSPIANSLNSASTSNVANAAGQNFGAMLISGMNKLDTSVKSANAAVTDFALGADMPPHQVMLALEDARMQLQFALQIRSRLVEGYQELMRMQL